MVSELDGRGRVIFVPGPGSAAPVWRAWSELFDANGYDPTVLVGDDVRPVTAQLDDALRDGRPPVVVGHGMGAQVAVGAVLGAAAPPGRDRTNRNPRQPRAEAVREAITPVAAVAISPSRRDPKPWSSLRARPWPDLRMPGWPTTGVLEPAWPGLAARRPRRPPGVPIVLIVGGAESARAHRAIVRLERRLRHAAPDEVTDRQTFPGQSSDLPVADSWRDVATFVLDWLTRQDL